MHKREKIKMVEGKYYDWVKQKPLSLNDGCSLDAWLSGKDLGSFAFHPNGFLVFLNPTDLTSTDEYAESDPYHVDLSNSFHEYRLNATLDLIKIAMNNLIDSEIRLLDIGCGKGFITGRIKDSFREIDVSGLDYSVSAIEYAMSHYSDLDCIVADAYAPPYVPEYFDIVICNNLWEHVPNPMALLHSISKVLRSNGYLIISTPSRYRLQNLYRILSGKSVKFMSRKHVTEYSVGQIAEQLAFGGFTVQEIYNKPIKLKPKSVKQFVFNQLLMPLGRLFLKMIHSNHSLESTVFYLAQKHEK